MDRLHGVAGDSPPYTTEGFVMDMDPRPVTVGMPTPSRR
jgi:hypothetical protein